MDDAHVPAISVDGLTKTYPGGVEAVRGISFDVPRGQLDGYRWLWVTSEQTGSGSTPSGDTALWGPLT